jgi:FkbM family methyltransferase
MLSSIRNLWKVPGPHSPASHAEVERSEWAFYLSYLREGMCAFDVGAHIGEVTLFFSRFVRETGSVHAFEPNKASFEYLSAACRGSARSNIVLTHAAVAETEREVELNVYDTEYASWSSLAERPLHEYGIFVKPIGKQKIPATTLDAYCEKHGIPYIDLLKIDVEGAEYQVLLGARRLLQEKRIRCCIFEFGRTTFEMGNRPEDFESYLTELGYKLRNVVAGDPTFPGRASAEAACFSMQVAVPK